MFLIASWGSSGAGKTTITLATAAALAKRHKDVLVVSTENRTPALPVFLPTVKDITGKNSIGELLNQDKLTEQSFKDRILRHPQSPHVFFMGMATGEVATFTYGTPKRASVRNMLGLLQQMPFQYIIVDCDSNALVDPTTLIALEWALFGVCTVTPDVKGYEFYKSQMTWLENSDTFRANQYKLAANQVLPSSPLKEATALFGGFEYVLPRSVAVQEKFVAGELLQGFSDMPGIEFERQINKMVDEIEEVNK